MIQIFMDLIKFYFIHQCFFSADQIIKFITKLSEMVLLKYHTSVSFFPVFIAEMM